MTAFPLELKSENLGWKAAMYQGNIRITTHKPSVTEEPRPMFKLAKSSFYDMFPLKLQTVSPLSSPEVRVLGWFSHTYPRNLR